MSSDFDFNYRTVFDISFMRFSPVKKWAIFASSDDIVLAEVLASTIN